ncbi:hypothetical protein PIB30_079613 [Stylosanthes scabra]|uniref:Myb-like domain-containing protein n=1 Tax=Stylosanthes scabra TaxID=79078 RepID=A0ABU6WR36_9FABA|nr:hypothetical protein [Stylosanthes scabra]
MNNIFSSTSTSSSTASDEDLEEKYRKKRKWKEYFRRLTRQVLAKQEEMQKRFLEAIEKREREQVAQQDAWRMQEMARINREHDILVQERSTAAAKDAAVIAFLQKISGQQTPPPTTTPPPTITVSFGAAANLFQQPPAPTQQPPPQPEPQPQPQPKSNLELQKVTNNGESAVVPLRSTCSSPSSRWPKAEVHALIRLRTSMEPKYQENGPKAPLWEDISAGMQRLGYNRSAKRCKEKWENINKYFKKVKESKKQRREDSKTCPYFHELDALYREKSSSKGQNTFHIMNKTNEMMMEPLMVQPEQQWRPPPPQEQKDKNNNNVSSCHQEDDESRKREREYDQEEEEEEEDDDGVLDDGDSAEDEGGNNRFEIATNKLSSVE